MRIIPIADNNEIKHYIYRSDGVEHDFHFFFDKLTGVSVREGLTEDGKISLPKAFIKSGQLTPEILNIMRIVRKQADIKMGPDPFWNPAGPELLDICVTTRCNKGCKYCYQAATPQGDDMPLDLYEDILMQASKTITQVALGGGEVTMHPRIADILKITREKFGVIPNYTTNGDVISEDLLAASKKFCGAVAVSAHGTRDEWLPKALRFSTAGIKTNVHFILSEDSAVEATEILKGDPIAGINAIIFLMYKPVGRASADGVLRTPSKISTFISALNETKVRVGFDSCSIPMICSQTKFSTVPLDTCEGGRFSGYVHVNGEIKPCSFIKGTHPNIREKRLLDVWAASDEFRGFRNALSGCSCDCPKKADCMGGCPQYKDIVICDLPGRRK